MSQDIKVKYDPQQFKRYTDAITRILVRVATWQKAQSLLWAMINQTIVVGPNGERGVVKGLYQSKDKIRVRVWIPTELRMGYFNVREILIPAPDKGSGEQE